MAGKDGSIKATTAKEMKFFLSILIGGIAGGVGGLIYTHGVFGAGVCIGIASGSAGIAIAELIKAERKR
jgi:hypothetical protein